MSSSGSSFRHPPSGAHAYRLRQRLRFGAMASARSALTHTDATENIVDVGGDAIPNIFEQLLARLEQHGLRRCFAEEEKEEEEEAGEEEKSNNDSAHRDCVRVDNTRTTATILTDKDCNSHFSVTRSSRHSSHSRDVSKSHNDTHSGEDNRVPYYYMCVPCETRLTSVSTTAATLTMLQDAHYHFSSAEHRSTASWMGDSDIDITLQSTPFVDPSGYIRICVNGVPMLLSTRPGGGDMFYPLPHEAHDGGRGVESGEVLWNRPLRSLYGGARQLLFGAAPRPGGRRKRARLRSQSRHAFALCRVPMKEYAEDTFVGAGGVPALFECGPRCAVPRLVWGGEDNDADNDKVVVVVGNNGNNGNNGDHAAAAAAAGGPLERVAVRGDRAYRVALVSHDAAVLAQAKAPEPSDGRVWLTRALLRDTCEGAAGSVNNASCNEKMSSSDTASGWSE